MLVPIHLSGNKVDQATGNEQALADAEDNFQVPQRERDAMDDLVDQLAALESKTVIG